MTERIRIEEFTQDGKHFIYIDLSELKSNEEFIEQIRLIEPIIRKYPKGSLYTITNMGKTRFDAGTKAILVRYLEHNKPYVKYGAVVDFDGIMKMMGNSAIQLSKRDNLFFALTKEQALEVLLQKE